jgi:hypothetical protein
LGVDCEREIEKPLQIWRENQKGKEITAHEEK